MRVTRLTVRRYRSIEDDTLECGSLVALVGSNGAGKSAFLRGLDLFYSNSIQTTDEDFYNRDTSKPIEIEVTFGALNAAAQDLFDKYLVNDTLTVVKVVDWNNGHPRAAYHGATLQEPGFAVIRRALDLSDRGKQAHENLDSLRSIKKYSTLPEWSTKDGVREALRRWEAENPDSCERARDDGQFFGFKEVAAGYLGRFTRLLFIPAVRDPSHDSAEGRASIFTQVMDLVVRSVLATKHELEDLQRNVAEQYANLVSGERNPELAKLADDLTGGLRTFVPQADVRLTWLPHDELVLPTPRADVKLVEDDYAAPVDRCGHGIQRAFVLAMLQRLAEAQVAGVSTAGRATERLPTLVLAIEEPELYQHPNRQRHFARVLRQLATGEIPGVAESTQVFYATHSPLFVGLDRIEEIRLLRKVPAEPGAPKVTQNARVALSAVAETLWLALGGEGERFTADSLRARLTALMTPWMNEGFFARLAVLVEGEDDRAAVLGTAMLVGIDLEGLGVSVIPCFGKTNIDRPLLIFRMLGIPVYVVWDGDKETKGAGPLQNRLLLKLLETPDVDWPSECNPRFTCFEDRLETNMRTEIGGELYDRLASEVTAELGMGRRGDALKNPDVVAMIVARAEEEGRRITTLRQVVAHIAACASIELPTTEEPEETPTPPLPEEGQIELGF